MIYRCNTCGAEHSYNDTGRFKNQHGEMVYLCANTNTATGDFCPGTMVMITNDEEIDEYRKRKIAV